MNIEHIPIMVMAKEIELNFQNHKIWIAICLLNHNLVTLGETQEKAIEDLRAIMEVKFGQHEEE